MSINNPSVVSKNDNIADEDDRGIALKNNIAGYKKCFLCGKQESEVKNFTKRALHKCAYSVAVKKHCGLRDGDVQIPARISLNIGYHSVCYKNFNALHEQYISRYEASVLARTDDINNVDDSPNDSIAGGSLPSVSESREGEKVAERDDACIYCNIVQKRSHKNNKREPCTKARNYESMEADKEIAKKFSNQDFLRRLNDKKLRDVPIYYHRSCKTSFQLDARQKCKPKDSQWHVTRSVCLAAFKTVYLYIEKEVVFNKNCVLMNSIQRMYANLVKEGYEAAGLQRNRFRTKSLATPLNKALQNKIRFVQCTSNVVIAPSSIKVVTNVDDLQKQDNLHQAALELRKIVQRTPTKPFAKTINTENLVQGECNIPEELMLFLKALYRGENYWRETSDTLMNKIEAVASDIIFGVSQGKARPSKSIVLGITIKNLTNSKKTLTLLNRHGHCISYTAVEELETEAAYTCINKSTVCPENIVKRDDLDTEVGADNFDKFVETADGKDTLHDTHMIVCQDVFHDTADVHNDDIEHNSSSNEIPAKRRRTFKGFAGEISAYHKKLSMTGEFQPHDHESIPESLSVAKRLDLSLVASHKMQIKTAMWVGHNAKLLHDNSVKQIIGYAAPINSSPTNNNVVLETLKRAVAVADECGQRYICYTGDLAVALKAMQIRSTESVVDVDIGRVFIHIGPWHTGCSLVSAIGTYIDGNGLTQILIDAGMLASGSLGSFLNAKNFNRAKRLHGILWLSLQLEHFDEFLRRESIILSEDLKTYLQSSQISGLPTHDIENEEFFKVSERYEAFKEQTLLGNHGKTAQHYMIYIQLFDHYHMLERSIRVGDFELYKYSLLKIANVMFAMNHYNYARWLVIYHNNLINVEKTHPGLEVTFKNGKLGLRRTDNNFARQPLDLVLEQTINADAGRVLTGIRNFTNSEGARMRWAIAFSVMRGVASYLLNKVGLTSVSSTNDLKECNIHKSIMHVQRFRTAINLRVNPFSPNLDKDKIYNIATGEAATADVAEFLLSVETEGENKRKSFTDQIGADLNKFKSVPVKRDVIKNFASLKKKTTVRSGDKCKELKGQRNMFGRVVVLMIYHRLNIEKLICYPLSPKPLSLSHLNGSFHKTDKAALTRAIEKLVFGIGGIDRDEPLFIETSIVDGFAIFHSMLSVPMTFGQIALKYLHLACSTATSVIHVVLDEYKKPSIKDAEHKIRECYSNKYTIVGHSQSRPHHFHDELKNDQFKISLAHFMIEYWDTQTLSRELSEVKKQIVDIVGSKTLYVNFERCYKYVVIGNELSRTVDEEYTCSGHEEADTKIIYHMCKIEQEDCNVLIRATDTDVLVIALANFHKVGVKLNVWMDFGTGNARRYINLNKIHEQFGDKLCRSLTGFHALTGCDYNPSMYKRGKVSPFNIRRAHEDYQDALINLLDDFEGSCEVLQEFVCRMYRQKGINSVNEARFAMFQSAYGANDSQEEFLKKAHNCDPSSLPPCYSELHQQLLRTRYISSIWSNANAKNPTMLDPVGNGWVLEDGCFAFHWYDGEMMPSKVSEILVGEEEDSEEDAIDEVTGTMQEDYDLEDSCDEVEEDEWDTNFGERIEWDAVFDCSEDDNDDAE